MNNGHISKEEQRRRQIRPLRLGVHSIAEYAYLRVVEGQTDREIAALWGMRPLAGPSDLRWDVDCLWERAGCPYGLPVPDSDFSRLRAPAQDEAWRLWREARKSAIPQWLRSLVAEGEPLNHCNTCTCHRPYDLDTARATLSSPVSEYGSNRTDMRKPAPEITPGASY